MVNRSGTMDGNDVSADHVFAELVDMGFEFSAILEAIEAVGPCLHDALEFILKGSCRNDLGTKVTQEQASSSYNCSTSHVFPSDRQIGSSHSMDQIERPGIMKYLYSRDTPVKHCASEVSASAIENFESSALEKHGSSLAHINHKLELSSASQHGMPPLKIEPGIQDNGSLSSQHSALFYSSDSQDLKSNWENKVNILLKKHFGFTSLKSFQKEALEAWLDRRDCLILAATGSGKSLCFQIPALLTGKVVVVISPLISLMHDQCLKLAQHGVSACFLGSGQTDSSVEGKAMRGMYRIIYVCPETVLRLVGPLQRLAEGRGIALFAIDEVHCVSKWGHDFRPDYRRLSVLRENFKASNLKSLKFDIPLMALTATATIHVREDILKSLDMSRETKIVLTSFFRPNLRFSVLHSRTSSKSSYEKDFRELIDTYTSRRMVGKEESNTNFHDLEENSNGSSKYANGNISDADERSWSDSETFEDDDSDGSAAEVFSENDSAIDASKENQMSVEYLEDELDVPQSVDDLDVSCGEFSGHSPSEAHDLCRSSETLNHPVKPDENLEFLRGPLGQGVTIIYMPTRKETVRLAHYLSDSGVRADAYHAKLPKRHLRRVHEEFHRNSLQVVVATIAFGMGIDKSNVRRIVHYGWPQSLEAYYQEAGRAGRDGKLADCTLYANLSRIPSLLPSKRSEEQTEHATKMLSDCFRYGMSTACCRAKTLVKYFGEDLIYDKCFLCDICVGGAPKLQNLKVEADIFLRVLVTQCGSASSGEFSYIDAICSKVEKERYFERLDLRIVIDQIRKKHTEFAANDQLWWRGLARILEDKGYIREAYRTRVCIKNPIPTVLGLNFLHSGTESAFCVHPEADMLLPRQTSNHEWRRGWANPEIRRVRLQGKKYGRRKRKRCPRSRDQSISTVRGRIMAKLSKQKH